MGDVFFLKGELGAGKTVLARGFLQALLGAGLDVTSPTFTLVQVYETDLFDIWHTDLYRLEDFSQLFELGLEEAFETSVSLIEWPDRLGSMIPQDRLEISLKFSQNGRSAHITPYGLWKDRWYENSKKL